MAFWNRYNIYFTDYLPDWVWALEEWLGGPVALIRWKLCGRGVEGCDFCHDRAADARADLLWHETEIAVLLTELHQCQDPKESEFIQWEIDDMMPHLLRIHRWLDSRGLAAG